MCEYVLIDKCIYLVSLLLSSLCFLCFFSTSAILFYTTLHSGIVPRLINLKAVDISKWIQDGDNNLYIGRYCAGLRVSSLWGNPFRITNTISREISIERFTAYFKNNPKMQQDLWQLCFKEMGCWCVPDQCHGQVLIDAVKHMLLFDLEYI